MTSLGRRSFSFATSSGDLATAFAVGGAWSAMVATRCGGGDNDRCGVFQRWLYFVRSAKVVARGSRLAPMKVTGAKISLAGLDFSSGTTTNVRRYILRANTPQDTIKSNLYSPSMSMPFLRPLGLPRPSTLTRFLGIARASTTAASATAAPSTSAPVKPYRVERTGTKNLPVYLLSKRGGNLKQTKVRRIEGNINVLRTELQEALGLEKEDVVINQLTQQIIIKVGFMKLHFEIAAANQTHRVTRNRKS